jgi:hypothetical protein
MDTSDQVMMTLRSAASKSFGKKQTTFVWGKVSEPEVNEASSKLSNTRSIEGQQQEAEEPFVCSS